MIRRLVLGRFGRFRDAVFDLGQVTVFLGPNESGKTTIADALLDALCQPPRNKKAGQALQARYGEDRDVRVEPAPAPEDRIDADEFRSLLCVTSGDLSIPLPAGAAWLDALKARLFTGGIDPRALAKQLERDGSLVRSTTAGKRLAEAMMARDRARQELGELRETRTATLGHERRLADAAARLASLAADLEARKAEMQTLDEDLRQQARIAQRRRCMDALRVLEDMDAADRALEQTAGVSGDDPGRLEELERVAAARQEVAQSAHQAADVARARLDQVKGALAVATAQAQTTRNRAELAARLQAGLAAPESQPRQTHRARYRTPLVVLGIVLVVAAASALALLPGPLSVVVGAMTAALGLALLALSARRERVQDNGPWVRAVEVARAEWERALGEPLASPVGDTLVRERLRHDSLMEEIERLSGETRRLGAVWETLSQEERRAEEARVSAAGEVTRFLRARGVSTTRDYVALRARRSHVLESRRGLEETVAALLAEYGVAGREELGRECRMRIQNLEQSITARDMDEPTRRRKEARQRQLDTEIRDLTAAWNDLNTELTRERGRIQGSLGNLPERIRRAEQELERRSVEAADMELDRKASALAAQIMASIGAESDGLLDGLESEMALLYAGIVGGTPGVSDQPEVRMTGLDLGAVSARDAGGTLQSYAHLSQGTRDAVALSARLALSARTGRQMGILVLDEPFLALDNDRARAALDVLRAFQARRGWQIVLLTKEVQIVVCARRVFGDDLVVHDLA